MMENICAPERLVDSEDRLNTIELLKFHKPFFILKQKIGHESLGACRQKKLIGGKPAVIK
jgi:hypothetical protein